MNNDNKKKFIPQLAIDTIFFHRAFANMNNIKPKALSKRRVPFCTIGN
jgi:hypothetical protein